MKLKCVTRVVYLELWHAADELVGQCHGWFVGVVKGNELRGQVAVPVKQPEPERKACCLNELFRLRRTRCFAFPPHFSHFACIARWRSVTK